MTLRHPTRPSASAALALTLLASLSAGCASSSGKDRGSGYAPGLVLSSPGWLNGTFAQPEQSTSAPSAPQYVGNAALRPRDPWIGTIGLRQRLSDAYEVGLGLAVPNPFTDTTQSPVAAERARDLGVGVWLKFDF
jgi:hypothetical protein